MGSPFCLVSGATWEYARSGSLPASALRKFSSAFWASASAGGSPPRAGEEGVGHTATHKTASTARGSNDTARRDDVNPTNRITTLPSSLLPPHDYLTRPARSVSSEPRKAYMSPHSGAAT